MLERKDLLPLSFYKKSPCFYGSLTGIRYRIEKIDDDLQCTIWPEPLGYEATDKALMTMHTEEFSEEGIQNITSWLNEKAKEANN